mgnify:CR=1 FL=1|tara:strand:- start:3861 stop:4340 length:480 start_codon:yes stop_codon:yes gene_type:complete
MPKIKEYNPNEKKEIINKKPVKKALTKKSLFKERVKKVEVNKYNTSFLIFHLLDFEKKYDISQYNLMLLLYLKDLALFPTQLEIVGRTIKLKELLTIKLIEEDYSVRGKVLYRLSLRGILIVDEFNSVIKDSTKYYLDNRNTDIDTESKIKSNIANYFS